MSNNFDEFVNKLQKEINEIEINNHNERIVNLCYNPENWGKPPEEEITVSEERYGGSKGYFLGLYLKIEEKIIVKANFVTDGCGVMIATGSQITILIKGHSIEFAEKIKGEDIEKALTGLPKNEEHCLDLAIETLRSAIKKYKSRKLI